MYVCIVAIVSAPGESIANQRRGAYIRCIAPGLSQKLDSGLFLLEKTAFLVASSTPLGYYSINDRGKGHLHNRKVKIMTKLVFRAFFNDANGHEVELSVYSTRKGFAVEFLDNTACEIIATSTLKDFDEAIAYANAGIKANGWTRRDERIFAASSVSFDGGLSRVLVTYNGCGFGSELRASIAWGRGGNTFSVCYDVESWGYASCLVCDEYDEFSEALLEHAELAACLFA